jgi:TonB family protein
MATGSKTRGWTGPSRRRVPRFRMQAPVDITVLRSGIPDKVPGRAINVCEQGIAAVLAGELVPGESVGLEVRLAPGGEPLRARATVRYQDKLQCGLEFVALTAGQRNVIREWAWQAKAGREAAESAVAMFEKAEKKETPPRSEAPIQTEPKRRSVGRSVLLALLVLAIVAVVFWWTWNRSWHEIESRQGNFQNASGEKPQAQVPAEVMQKLLIHRVEPVYPPEARKQHLQGIIALDIVVGRDGSVMSMRALNGPDVLAKAAMDALRWWKFAPYRLNGEPAAVETTLAVEFK